MILTPPVAKVLPADAAAMLVRAATIPRETNDPNARVKAIDKAAERVRRMYPNLFRKESQA